MGAALEREFMIAGKVATRIEEIKGTGGSQELAEMAVRLANLAGAPPADALEKLVEIAQRARIVREAAKVAHKTRLSDQARRDVLSAAIKANERAAAIIDQLPALTVTFADPYLSRRQMDEFAKLDADDARRLHNEALREAFTNAAGAARSALAIMEFEGQSTKGESDVAVNAAAREVIACVDEIRRAVPFDNSFRFDVIEAIFDEIGLQVGEVGDRDALRKRLHRLKDK